MSMPFVMPISLVVTRLLHIWQLCQKGKVLCDREPHILGQ